MKVAFHTLGCKVNQYETNAMMQSMLENGYEIVDFAQKADIYILNTCTVTNISDRKSRQFLRRAKQNNPDAIIVAVGCYVQVAKQEIEKMEEIDLALGNNEKNDILEYIQKFLEERKRVKKITQLMEQKEYNEFGSVTFTEKTRAVIKIQDGCDRFCSYCIIPYARGRVRSRSSEEIVTEIEKIAKKGIYEVVLTGIHITSYGKDLSPKECLLDLLKKIHKIEGIKRIRLGSLEPTLITRDFVEQLSKLEKVCEHFHLSLQSGCDATLQRMNRKYTTKEFRQSVELLRNAFADVHLTTDIIVGFPQETEEEFETTYQFLKEIQFYQMHIFKYSPREGTKAAIMSGQISGEIKEQRSKKLIELSNEQKRMYQEKSIGKMVEVLLEERQAQAIKGHTRNYERIEIQTQQDLENKLVMAKIEGIQEDHLIAKLECHKTVIET